MLIIEDPTVAVKCRISIKAQSSVRLSCYELNDYTTTVTNMPDFTSQDLPSGSFKSAKQAYVHDD